MEVLHHFLLTEELRWQMTFCSRRRGQHQILRLGCKKMINERIHVCMCGHDHVTHTLVFHVFACLLQDEEQMLKQILGFCTGMKCFLEETINSTSCCYYVISLCLLSGGLWHCVTRCVTLAGLELMFIPFQALKFWDYRLTPPCPCLLTFDWLSDLNSGHTVGHPLCSLVMTEFHKDVRVTSISHFDKRKGFR